MTEHPAPDAVGSPDETQDAVRGLTRRELLERAARAGGALLWATPVVHVVGMAGAHAAETSANCFVYCLAWRPSPRDDRGKWRSRVSHRSRRDPVDDDTCLPCPAEAVAGLPPNIDQFEVTFDAGFFTVTYPETCSLVPSGDPTPDELADGSAALRCDDDCVLASASDETHDQAQQTRSIVLGPCPDGRDEDEDHDDVRIQLIIQCCA